MGDFYLDRLRLIFSSLITFSDKEWETGVRYFTTKTWRANEIVLAADTYTFNIYFIIEGRARYYYLTSDGDEKTKSITRAGGTLASLSTLVNNEPCPFFIETLTACTTASIRYKDLMTLADTYRNWNILIRKLLEQLALKKERREASFLLLNAQQRYEQFLSEFGDEADEIPLRQVAMYLGITDVTLSRIRKGMGLT
jgi:CRP-like cAMP-binding protein